ncbi:MAG: site-2 protease family protein [Gaiellales bacterium]|jgi:Zn-dependent protease|nr:site-2 protease family protein [Gaiellales bacterium]
MFGNIDSAFSPANLELLAFLLPILVVSMVLHEMAHGYVANRLGDPTARMLGRLSPNPARHVDPLGSAMFAISWIASGGTFLFGWAKPIPVQPRFFNHPQRGFAIVAIAGPLTNILIAYVLAIVLSVTNLVTFGPDDALYSVGDPNLVQRVLIQAFLLNIWLAVFNMLPIPPLDGSRVLGAFMPRQMYAAWARLDQYGMFFLIGLIFFFRPLLDVVSALTDPIATTLLKLAGV